MHIYINHIKHKSHVLLMTIATMLLSCQFTTGGDTSQNGLIDRFIGALRGSDHNEMSLLIKPHYDANQEIKQLIASYGGCKFTSLQTDIQRNTIAGFLADAHIKGDCLKNGIMQSFSLSISMELTNNNKWYIVLGKNKGGIIPVSSGSPSTTMPASPQRRP